jgi:hypothetical protein
MRSHHSWYRVGLLSLLVTCGILVAVPARAGSAFTYQGQLQLNGQPLTTECTFVFSLWDALSGGTQHGDSVELNDVVVTNGLFTVQLDFGGAALVSGNRWLQTAVGCEGGPMLGTLSPRQPLTSAPYAYRADTVAASAVGASQIAPDAVTSAKIADGTITAADVDTSSLQRRVTGNCALNMAMSYIEADGTVGCTATGGLTLPYLALGSDSSPLFSASNTGSGAGLQGLSTSGIGVWGKVGGGSGLGPIAPPGVYGDAASSPGVYGTSNSGAGALGQSVSNTGVGGVSTSGSGVTGGSTSGSGVRGTTGRADAIVDAGVVGESTGNNGIGVRGVANTGTSARGVFGESTNGHGVYGTSTNRAGVYGTSGKASTMTEAGVVGESTASHGIGVRGVANTGNGAWGVFGESADGRGVYGKSTGGYGVFGKTEAAGPLDDYGSAPAAVTGESSAQLGVGVRGVANADYAVAVEGTSDTGFASIGVNGEVKGESGFGIRGWATSTGGVGVTARGASFGITALSDAGTGVSATGATTGVYGHSQKASAFEDAGVVGEATENNGIGVRGVANVGTNAWAINGESANGYAGYFDGKVHISGTLTKSSGSFKIDHPLDPANKYLSHSFVESPDMKNVYDGIVVLDNSGEAVVELPAWFGVLNRDFRYQLTCIGSHAPVYVAEKIHDNRFRIGGGTPGLEVSWQVTGIRQDAFAKAHPILVEEEKPAEEKGFYLHPVELGQPESLSVSKCKAAAK